MDYSDVKMVRESEFAVDVAIVVKYQAEKVAEKITFLKNQAKFESFFFFKKYYMLFYTKQYGESSFSLFKNSEIDFR